MCHDLSLAMGFYARHILPWGIDLTCGCHSGRPIPKIVEEAGWTIETLEQGYIKGPKPLAFNYWGAARA